MAGQVGTAYVKTELDPTGVKKGLQEVEGETKRRMGGVGADLKKGFEKAFVPALAGFGAVAFGAKKAVDAASDLGEQVNKASVVFGKSAPVILDWSKTTAKGLGISQRAALEAAGTFGNMLVPMGVARDEAARMSKRMVTLGADMASFNNASPEETLDAIRAGLAGETEPLRRFGVFLNEARIQQEALNLGLIKGSGALEAAQAAVKTATAQVATAQKARTAATAQVEAATRRLTEAEKAVEGSAAAVASAQDKLRSSSERLSDSEDRQAAAAQRVKDAKQALTEAQRRARSAQQDLTAARVEAANRLKDLKEAADDSVLSEERASIGLERAREKLAKVSGDSESTELDRREAMLAVKEAEDGLSDAQAKRSGTATDLAKAEKAGIEGSKEVLAARKEIRDADLAAEKAATRVRATQRALADTQDAVRDATRGVVKAQQELRTSQEESRQATAEVSKAQQGLSQAQQRSQQTAQALTTAQANLTKAKQAEEKVSKTTSKTLTAEQKARATYSLILKDTKDQQGDVTRTGKSVANTQRRIAAETEDATAAMGKGLIPAYSGLQGMMESLVKLGGKHVKATQALVGVFAALTALVIAVNVAMKVYAAYTGVAAAVTKLLGKEQTRQAIATKLQAIWTGIVSAATKAWTAVQWLLNAALSANPIGLVVIALVALVAGLILAYKKSETFRDIVDGAFKAVLEVAQEVADFFTKDLPDAFKAVLDWLKRHWDEIAVLISGPFAPLVLLATDAFGIRSALIDAFEAILGFVKKQGSALYNAGKELGSKLKDGVVDAVTGIGNAVWAVVDNIGQRISQAVGLIQGWGRSVGTWIKDAVINAIVGVGEGAWQVVNNIWTAISSRLAVIQGWGSDIGNWIKNAVIGALRGIGDGAWAIVNNIWEVLSSKKDLILGWGNDIGTWLKRGIVNGLKGLGDLIRKLLKKALPGPLERFIPGGRAVTPPAPGPAPQAGPMETQAGLLGAGGGGGLAGQVPIGYQLRRALSGLGPDQAVSVQPTEVRVFIGDQELRGIVRAEVISEDTRTAQTLLAGVR
jgi:phage-related protein